MRTAAIGCVALVLAAQSACGAEPAVTSLPIDGRPSAVTIAEGHVWVADDENDLVHVIDARAARLVGDPIEVERNPIAMAASRGRVYVAHANGSLTAIDARTRRVADVIEVGGSLTGIDVAGDGVWVTDLERDRLVRIDRDAGRVQARIEMPDGAVRVAAAGKTLWVTGRENTVTRVEDGEASEPVEVGVGPIGLAASRDRVFVTNSDDDTVTILGAEGRVLRTERVVGAPIAAALRDGPVWVACQDGGTVVALNGSTGRTVGDHIDVGMQPRGIASDPAHAVWVVGTNPSRAVRVVP